MRLDTMAHLSYVQEIMAKSAYTMQAETVFPSVTLPCHMSLFLGVPAQRHGVTTNVYTPPARPMSGLCEQLNLARKSCAVFYDWEELRDLWRPGSVAYARLEREQTKEVSDRSTDAALAYIAERSPDFVFLYLGWPDAGGYADPADLPGSGFYPRRDRTGEHYGYRPHGCQADGRRPRPRMGGEVLTVTKKAEAMLQPFSFIHASSNTRHRLSSGRSPRLYTAGW